MSFDVDLIPKPEAYVMPDAEYRAYAGDMFCKLELLAENDCEPAEWAATVLAKIAAPTQTIALPLEAIETLLQYADQSLFGSTDYREKAILGEVAYAYMRKTGVWLDLQSVNPPRSVEVSDRVLI